MKKRYALSVVTLLVSAFLCLFVAGCSTDSSSSTDGTAADAETNGKMVVGVSIVPEQTFVEAVCGDLVDVVTMVPPGSSPENYEPTQELMEKLSDASAYFSIGVPTEETNILPSIGPNTKVVSLQDAVAQVYPDRTFDSGARDPHVWLSPKRAVVMVQTIRDEMCELDPDNAEAYQANAKDYIDQLEDLDGYIADQLEDVSSRDFIVYHPAFGYYADDYGLTMYALEEDGKEATAENLENMVDFAKENDIKAIFYQAEIDSSQSQTFAQEIGGRTMQLSPLAADYIQNLKSMTDMIAGTLQ